MIKQIEINIKYGRYKYTRVCLQQNTCLSWPKMSLSKVKGTILNYNGKIYNRFMVVQINMTVG